MLRYGDGTPFPFDDAFLDMLVDAVEACTTMLAATANLDRRRADAEAVLEAIGEEERRLLMFERAVAAACGPAPGGKPTPAVRAAERTRTAMESAVERSREQLKQISATRAAPPSWHRTARRVQAAVGRFFARRLLPGTRWAWAWDASGMVPCAEAASQDARFRVVYDLDLPPAWRAPVRIDALVPDLVVHLPRRRWLRPAIETAIPLGRCLLVGARHDDRGRELVIRKPDGSGWRIDLPEASQASATALDRRGRARGTGLVREPELAALVQAIDRELDTLQLRRCARKVKLDGVRVTELADTTLAARALLDELGPTVRAIRQRSRMPGELTLKRDVADGVREEIYVSRASLTARYGNLPAEHRRLLDDAGFGRGLTTGISELAAQAPQPAIPARPTPPPIPARPSSPSLQARSSAPVIPARPPEPAPSTRPSERPTPARPADPSASARLTVPALPPRPTEPTLARTTAPAASPARAKPTTAPPPARAKPTTAPPPAAPPTRHQTHRLFPAPPARSSATALPISRRPSGFETTQVATLVGDQPRPKDEPTIPSILAAPRPYAVPAIRPRVEVAAELSEVVTPPLIPHIPSRRLQTPTG
jgi:hypothetical protein